jgi:hypothetical protein
MNSTVTNGEHDATTTTTTTTTSSVQDSHKQTTESTYSPPTDLVDADETHTTLADPSTILPTDLAVALSLDLQQTTTSPPSPEEPSQYQGTLSEAQDQASYYWDASTMAPLNAISAVSVFLVYY